MPSPSTTAKFSRCGRWSSYLLRQVAGEARRHRLGERREPGDLGVGEHRGERRVVLLAERHQPDRAHPRSLGRDLRRPGPFDRAEHTRSPRRARVTSPQPHRRRPPPRRGPARRGRDGRRRDRGVQPGLVVHVPRADPEGRLRSRRAARDVVPGPGADRGLHQRPGRARLPVQRPPGQPPRRHRRLQGAALPRPRRAHLRVLRLDAAVPQGRALQLGQGPRRGRARHGRPGEAAADRPRSPRPRCSARTSRCC